MTRRLGLKAALAACLAGLVSPAFVSPALAHPHVWVTAKAEIVFAADGRVTGIRHAWTFDEAYTAYVTQGLDRNGDGKLTPEELQPLADENTGSLEEFGYFTTVKVNGRKQAFDPPREPRMAMEKSQVVMSYFLPLKTPAAASGAVAMEIDDPSFFVYFTLAEGKDSITLTNAPQGCATSIAKAKPLDAAMQQILQAEGALPPSLSGAAQYANRAIVACP
jgi:ABC-type uncharacterized transport system substrate-binding protein